MHTQRFAIPNPRRWSTVPIIAALVVILMMVPAQLRAAIFYLDFTGTDATGAVGTDSSGAGGTSFTGKTWALEYQIDSTVACSACSSTTNQFAGAILGGSLSIGGTIYTLSEDSASGTLTLFSFPDQYDALTINPTRGGVMAFQERSGDIFPSLFSNIASLQSANPGTTIAGTTASHQSTFLSYPRFPFILFPIFRLNAGVVTTTADLNISAFTPDNPALWTVSVHRTAQLVNGTAAEISGQVSVTQSGFGRNRTTGLWSATMTVTNTSGQSIPGPVQVVLAHLSANATMTNKTGVRNGSYYVTMSAGPLAPGASATVPIQFLNPSNGFISFTPIAYSGGF